VVVLLLALCGLGGAAHRRERFALGTIGILFLLVSFGGHTPFYRLWYELMPLMKKVRAAGSAFFLVALPVCVLAGFGVDRLFAGEVPLRRIGIGAGIFVLIGLLGSLGGLDGIAQAIAAPELVQRAVQHAGDLHAGSLRLLVLSLAGGALLLALGARRLSGWPAVFALIALTTADLWSIDRNFFVFSGTAEQIFGNDEITRKLRETPLPYRVWDPKGEQYGGAAAYPGSWLMGQDVPQLLGYHGNELRSFDDLLGEKNIWRNQVNAALLDLYAVRYVLFNQPQNLPGYHKILGPVTTTPGAPGVLYEADSLPPYVRLMAGAIRIPEDRVVETVSDPRFPSLQVAVYPDSAPVSAADLGGKVPAPTGVQARVAAWDAGSMRIVLNGRDERPLYLVVAENWYKDWRATVDGAPVPALRAQHTLLSVLLPPGAKEVRFEFRSPEYERGRLISLLAVAATLGFLIVPALRRRGTSHG
jgi:hypothetical protein